MRAEISMFDVGTVKRLRAQNLISFQLDMI